MTADLRLRPGLPAGARGRRLGGRKLRSIQSRVFDTPDENRTMRAVIATLQDLGFVIDKANSSLGIVSATRLSGYVLKMTVSVRTRGETQVLV